MTKILENKWYCALLSGILLGLSFPPFDLAILAIPGFALLLQLTVLSEKYSDLAAMSFLSFLIWNLITTYWLMMASAVAGIAAVIANSLLMCIPLCMMRFVMRRYDSPLFNVFVLSFLWVFYEYLHHNWELSWPWLAIGNAWANFPSLIHYISVTGSLGISFWVVLTAGFLFYLVNDNNSRYLIGGMIALLIFPAWSLLIKAFYVPPIDPPTMEVAIIQPNFDSYYRYGGFRSQSEALDKIFEVSNDVRDEDTDLIIWPENSIDSNVRLFSRITNRISDSARVWNTDFLVGSGFVKEYTADDSLPTIYREDDDFRYNIYNSAIYINSDAERTFYEKRNLVPFVERVPYANFLSKMDVLGIFDWGDITGFGKGEISVNFEVNPNFYTPGLVCYDSVFPGWVRSFVKEGATFITIITNDGWWGDTSGHHQHFAYARLRAIEFDRWIARAANNGISGVIAPDGSIVEQTEYWERTGINATIEAKRSKTFYLKYGDWLPIGGGMASVLIWLYGYVRDPRRSESKS